MVVNLEKILSEANRTSGRRLDSFAKIASEQIPLKCSWCHEHEHFTKDGLKRC